MNNIRFYKANKNNNGFASQWSIGEDKNKKYDRWSAFLIMAKQVGMDENENAKFDWDNSIKVKLDTVDIGEILAVLNGRKNSLGFKGMLYHESPNGGCKVIKLDWKEEGYFSLSVSGQDKDKNTLGNFFHSLSFGEVEILSIYLKKCVETIYGFTIESVPCSN